MKKIAVTGIITASILLISGLGYLFFSDYANPNTTQNNGGHTNREINRQVVKNGIHSNEKTEEKEDNDDEKKQKKSSNEIRITSPKIEIKSEATSFMNKLNTTTPPPSPPLVEKQKVFVPEIITKTIENHHHHHQQQQKVDEKENDDIVISNLSIHEDKEPQNVVEELKITNSRDIVPETSSSKENHSQNISPEVSTSEERQETVSEVSSSEEKQTLPEASSSTEKREKKKREGKKSSKKSKESKSGEKTKESKSGEKTKDAKSSEKKRERKNSDKKKLKIPKLSKLTKETVDIEEQARILLEVVEQVEIPTKSDEKEKFIFNKVSEGEKLVAKGEDYYLESTLPFYCALKAYHKPLELIVLLQKQTPEIVFQIIIHAMTMEQKNIQNGFYVDFPPADTHVKLAELPSNTLENSQTMRRGLVADKDMKAGEVIYEEFPLISALNPDMEGKYCNFCMKTLNENEKVECSYCDRVGFCSNECEQQAQKLYHQFMCTDNKTKVHGAKETAFYQHVSSNNLKYPQMIARFASSILAEEMEKKQTEKQKKRYYTSWDHVDRFRYVETSATENTTKEIFLLKDVLMNKVPGISQLLTDEIYLALKGKLIYNCYSVPDFNSPPLDNQQQNLSEENHRQIPTLKDHGLIGVGLYKISTYIGHSESNPNVQLEYRSGNNILTIIASTDIKKGEELVSNYTLPTN
ncbi:unnamed protein product [Cunninghamella blakesleeana]